MPYIDKKWILENLGQHLDTGGIYDDNKRCKKKSKIVSLLSKKWLSLAYNEFIVVDLETTGLNKNNDYIIEVAAIRYQKGYEVDKFVTLINPCVYIPAGVSRIHGIYNEHVANSPTIEKVLPRLLDYLGNSLLVAHNANFDIGFIEVWAGRLSYEPHWNYVDTISVAKKFIPGLPNYKQHTILDAIGYKQNRYHRAEDDCRGCAEIMNIGINSLISGTE